MKKGYVAGPLFNESEVKQRIYEGQVLRDKTGDKIEWFNPIEAPINDKDKLPTATDIFNGDTEQVIHSDYIIADLTNNDVGVAKELGISYGLQYARWVLDSMFKDQDEAVRKAIFDTLDMNGIKAKQLIGINSDIRLKTADKYSGIHIPYGINQYLIGGVESVPSMVFDSFEKAVAFLVSELDYKENADE